jgi:predicted transcriptional regulator
MVRKGRSKMISSEKQALLEIRRAARKLKRGSLKESKTLSAAARQVSRKQSEFRRLARKYQHLAEFAEKTREALRQATIRVRESSRGEG